MEASLDLFSTFSLNQNNTPQGQQSPSAIPTCLLKNESSLENLPQNANQLRMRQNPENKMIWSAWTPSLNDIAFDHEKD